LSIVHATLSDEDKRRSYDATGEIEAEDVELNQSEKEWYDYWRNLFPAVTLEKIQTFQSEYQGSEEERGDVLRAYEEGEGKMADVVDNVMLATDADEARFREVIEAAIAAKEVKHLKGFKSQLKDNDKRKKAAAKEAQEAEELMRAIQAKRGPDALANMAKDRKRQMTSFLDSLEEKYAESGGKDKDKGKKKSKKATTTTTTEMTDEEFQKLRDSITAKKGRE
jgi:DnaJ family protein C protein 9